jgi:oxygen-dependent protoporphyrinogen oxidase
MKGKITLLVGGAVGYVLGTRAGRQRYEQIKARARSVWASPKVQEKATQAQDYARQKAPVVKEKAAGAAAAAKDKVSS